MAAFDNLTASVNKLTDAVNAVGSKFGDVVTADQAAAIGSAIDSNTDKLNAMVTGTATSS